MHDDDFYSEEDSLVPLTPAVLHVKDFLTLANSEISTVMDINWRQRDNATRALLALTSASLMKNIRHHLPQVHTVILREDTSHLPAHGHIDDLLDSEGVSCFPEEEDWHDLDWTHEADEAVWDIYYLSSASFTRDDDGVRRLRITL